MTTATRAGFRLALGAAALTAFCGATLADTAVNVVDDKPLGTQSAGPVDDLSLALRLANFGAQNRDAMALIAAARIMGGFDVMESDLQAREPRRAEPAGNPQLTTADEMLAAAREYAGDRPDLIAMIDDVAAEGTRGTRGFGYYYYEDAIDPDDRLAYDERFFGDEPAMVALNGWSDTDLDLIIYDEFGNAVCESAGHSAEELCEWLPRWTAQFTVVVLNKGEVENTYSLWTN